MSAILIDKINKTTGVLQTNSNSFKNFLNNYYLPNTSSTIPAIPVWQGMMNYFVNVDAHKDNKDAFINGSNEFFQTSYPSLNSHNFKETMREIINDLKKKNLAYNLHVYKLKYSAGKKVPPPDMLKYVDKNTNILGCYDSGKKGNEIFGEPATHESCFKNYEVLCSIANKKIDPGPSGTDCKVIIPPYDISQDIFDLFGYKNIFFEQFTDEDFQLTLSDSNKNVKIIDQKHSSMKYLKGNANNASFFSQNSNKLECDYRTTCKKLGDDLQVILSFMYKLLDMKNQKMLIMLTCDLGFTFLSLLLGHNIISKEKEDIQSDKYGNYTFIRSVVDNVSSEELKEIHINNLKHGIIEQWEDFNTIIQYIKQKIQSKEGVYIQFKGDKAYHLKNMVTTDAIFQFFWHIHDTIKTIIQYIDTYRYNIDWNVECVPMRFIHVHKNNPNTYLFTSQKQFSKGKLIQEAFKQDRYTDGFLMECNKLIKQELLKKNSRVGTRGGTRKKRMSGGGDVDVISPGPRKKLLQKYFFIEGLPNSELENFKNDVFNSYNKNKNYFNFDKSKYDCLSYVDDCMSANPNVDNIDSYVNEYYEEWGSIAKKYYAEVLGIRTPNAESRPNRSISHKLIARNDRSRSRDKVERPTSRGRDRRRGSRRGRRPRRSESTMAHGFN